MAIRFGIVPIVEIDGNRGPAHIRWHQSQDEEPGLIDVTRYVCVDYRFVDWGILVVDAPDDVLLSLVARDGITAFPVNLDTTPNAAARNQISNALDAINVPSQWVSAGLTWRQIVRIVTSMFLFAQALRRRTGVSPFDWPNVT